MLWKHLWQKQDFISGSCRCVLFKLHCDVIHAGVLFSFICESRGSGMGSENLHFPVLWRCPPNEAAAPETPPPPLAEGCGSLVPASGIHPL